MIEDKIKDRLEFLAKKFEVFENTLVEIKNLIDTKKEKGYNAKVITDSQDNTLALVFIKENEEHAMRQLKTVSISLDVFTNMIAADPTPNKSCVQWMLNVFTRFLKEGTTERVMAAIRFVTEDLPQANEYITIFEANKRKKRFLDMATKSYALKQKENALLKGLKDPTDINQYKSLSQLFDVVDPFIERNPSELESLLVKYVTFGHAEIPVRDRKFTLYIPKTTDASVVFDNFANWCTAKKENGMFKHYTGTNKTPEGKDSKLFIIINNDFFKGESDEIYQIHFETSQIKDRKNAQDVSIFENVINKSESLSNYFYEYLINLAKKCKTGLDNNKYLDALVKFGFCESLFELLDTETPIIRFMTKEVPKVPNLERFKNLDMFIITDAKMVELHPSIGNLTQLEMLILTNNRLKTLPREIGKLKNLAILNIKGNPLTDIPFELSYLDKSKGGSLLNLIVDKKEIGEENYNKLKEWLPSIKL